MPKVFTALFIFLNCSGCKLSSYENCVISITVYSNSTQDVVNPLLYQGFIEETVELLELEQTQFSVSCLLDIHTI